MGKPYMYAVYPDLPSADLANDPQGGARPIAMSVNKSMSEQEFRNRLGQSHT